MVGCNDLQSLILETGVCVLSNIFSHRFYILFNIYALYAFFLQTSTNVLVAKPVQNYSLFIGHTVLLLYTDFVESEDWKTLAVYVHQTFYRIISLLSHFCPVLWPGSNKPFCHQVILYNRNVSFSSKYICSYWTLSVPLFSSFLKKILEFGWKMKAFISVYFTNRDWGMLNLICRRIVVPVQYTLLCMKTCGCEY